MSALSGSLLPWSFLYAVHYQSEKTTSHLTANTSSYVVAPMGKIDTPCDLSSKDETNSSFRPAQYSYSLRSSSEQPCPVPHLSTRLLMFLMPFFRSPPPLSRYLNSFCEIPIVTSTTAEDLVFHVANSTGSWVWSMSLQVSWKTSVSPISFSRSLFSKANPISVTKCYYYLNHIMHAIDMNINIILVYA